VDAAYGDKSLSISQINRIILAVKAGKNIISAVATSLEETRRFTVRELAIRHGLTVWVVYQILTVDLGLVNEIDALSPKTSVTSTGNFKGPEKV
jgi:hypothetical protein